MNSNIQPVEWSPAPTRLDRAAALIVEPRSNVFHRCAVPVAPDLDGHVAKVGYDDAVRHPFVADDRQRKGSTSNTVEACASEPVVCSASISAASSTIGPRDVFTR